MVSVIVPAYNVGDYIDECIRSIMLQTVVELEIIIVDDGSTDATGMICDSYAEIDGRIKVIHIANDGQAHARNVGLDKAKGEYVMFVDADDVIHGKFIEIMLDVLDSTGADIAECNFYESETAKWTEARLSKENVCVFSTDEALLELLYQHQLMPTPWNKLYKRAVFDDIRFIEGIVYEDLEAVPRMLEQACKIAYAPIDLYFYRQREGSTMHVFSPRRFDVLGVVDAHEARYAAKPEISKAARDRKFAANFNMFALASLSSIDYKAEVDKCWENVKNLRREVLFNKRSRLKNKIGALLSYMGKKITLAVASKVYR